MGRNDVGDAVGSAVLRPPDGDAASYPGVAVATESTQYGRAQAAGLRATVSFYAASDDHERRDPQEFHNDRAIKCTGEAEVREGKVAVSAACDTSIIRSYPQQRYVF